MLEHIILTCQLLSDKSMRDIPVGVTDGSEFKHFMQENSKDISAIRAFYIAF